MRTIEINVGGRRLPLRATMGALKDFKKLTGRDPKEMAADSPLDLAIFLYCCIRSACRKDGVRFETGLDDFLDSVDAETINGWSGDLASASHDGSGDDPTRPPLREVATA